MGRPYSFPKPCGAPHWTSRAAFDPASTVRPPLGLPSSTFTTEMVRYVDLVVDAPTQEFVLPLFLVTFDLRSGRDYPDLHAAFDDLGALPILESVVLLDLMDGASAEDVKEHIRPHIDDSDGLFVVEFSEHPAGFRCKKGTGDWLKSRFDQTSRD